LTSWYSHFVEFVVDVRLAARWPRKARDVRAISLPYFAQCLGFDWSSSWPTSK
jgi:hypothetical protein